MLRKVLLGVANSPLSTSHSEGWVAKGWEPTFLFPLIIRYLVRVPSDRQNKLGGELSVENSQFNLLQYGPFSLILH